MGHTKNILIVYTTRFGQTKKIARYLETSAAAKGMKVRAVNIATNPNLKVDAAVDLVICGFPIYVLHGSFLMAKWLCRSHPSLRSKTVAFFSVSLNAADQQLRGFIDCAGFVPNYVASFAGALRYRDYNPFIRAILKRIAIAEGGETDTTRNFEYTDWPQVDAFLRALLNDTQDTPFGTAYRFPIERSIDKVMPVFDFAIKNSVVVPGTPSVAYAAFCGLTAKDAKLARFLSFLRSGDSGGDRHPHDLLFFSPSENSGAMTLSRRAPIEVVGGLVGRFWRRDFGLRHIAAANFPDFNEPGYTKVATRFHFAPVLDVHSERTWIGIEMRIASTDRAAAAKFKIYWRLLSPGIYLYVKSILAATHRGAARLARNVGWQRFGGETSS